MSKSKLQAIRSAFAAGLVCLLIALTAGDLILSLYQHRAAPGRIALEACLSLLSILYLLKVLLPVTPHWRSMLILTSLLFIPSVLNVLVVVDINISPKGFDVIDVARALPYMLVLPQIYLIIGLIAKKRVDKAAGLIMFGSTALFWLASESGYMGAPGNMTLEQVRLRTLAAFFYAILYFTWPVLKQPVLQRKEVTA